MNTDEFVPVAEVFAASTPGRLASAAARALTRSWERSFIVARLRREVASFHDSPPNVAVRAVGAFALGAVAGAVVAARLMPAAAQPNVPPSLRYIVAVAAATLIVAPSPIAHAWSTSLMRRLARAAIEQD